MLFTSPLKNANVLSTSITTNMLSKCRGECPSLNIQSRETKKYRNRGLQTLADICAVVPFVLTSPSKSRTLGDE